MPKVWQKMKKGLKSTCLKPIFWLILAIWSITRRCIVWLKGQNRTFFQFFLTVHLQKMLVLATWSNNFYCTFFHFSRRSSYGIQDSGTIFSESEEENLSESEFKIFELDDNDRLTESQGFEDNISTWAKYFTFFKIYRKNLIYDFMGNRVLKTK